MNRFRTKPKVNPAFKVVQPLPALAAGPAPKHPGELPCRSAVPAPSPEGRLSLPAMRLDGKNYNPAKASPVGNSLCKNFAFTNLSQVV